MLLVLTLHIHSSLGHYHTNGPPGSMQGLSCDECRQNSVMYWSKFNFQVDRHKASSVSRPCISSS